MKWLVALVATWMLACAAPAAAAWQRGESEHFVVYADDSPRDIERFGAMLERYQAAMEHLTGRTPEVPSPSNRVTIYVVGGQRAVSDLAGSRSVAGFYVPRAGAAAAFAPRIDVSSRGELDFSLVVLLHEYAHHFMWTTTNVPLPNWLSEGSAEFFASALFPSDGAVHVGRPAYHRSGELSWLRADPVEELFDPELFRKRHGNSLSSFYGSSWLLYHYLVFSPARAGQFDAYWRSIVAGSDPLEAAHAAFGDFRQLDRELRDYMSQRRWSHFNLTPDMVPAGEITVTPVSEGMAAMMPVIIELEAGPQEDDVPRLAERARTIAARYPADAGVLAAVARAEYQAKAYAEAIAAADRALAIDPASKQALATKGEALFELAAASGGGDAAYAAVMRPLAALNALENDHPLPMIYLDRTTLARGRPMGDDVKQALERAAQLAPFDGDLQFDVALMHAEEGRTASARRELAVIAGDPHGGRRALRARALAQALESATAGEPFDATAVLEAFDAANPEAGAEEDEQG